MIESHLYLYQCIYRETLKICLSLSKKINLYVTRKKYVLPSMYVREMG